MPVVLVATSGCLAILDLDEGTFDVTAGADATAEGGEGGLAGKDAAPSGDDDDAADAFAASDVVTVSRARPPDLCVGPGWHRDCDFGDGGFFFVSSPTFVTEVPVAIVDAFGNVQAVANSDELGATSLMSVVDGGATVSTLAPTATPGFVVDMRPLDNGDLALLRETATLQVLASRVSAGVIVETVTTSLTRETWSHPQRFLTLAGSTWTASAVTAANGDPEVISFDMTTGGASELTAAEKFPFAASVAVDAGAWMVSGDGGQAYGELTGPPLFLSAGACVPSAGLAGASFSDLVAIDDTPVAIVADVGGFVVRSLGDTCPVLAAYDDAYFGPAAQSRLARGTLAGSDSLVALGDENADGGDALAIATLIVSSTAGGDVSLRVDDGGASGIMLGSGVALGRPAVAGGALYLPFLRAREANDGGGSGAVADFFLLRLVSTP